jgi:hypothetical protein
LHRVHVALGDQADEVDPELGKRLEHAVEQVDDLASERITSGAGRRQAQLRADVLAKLALDR